MTVSVGRMRWVGRQPYVLRGQSRATTPGRRVRLGSRLAAMPYRPVASLKRNRYVSLSEASDLLGGLLAPGTIREMVRAGQVPGAVRARGRYFVLRRTVGELITDMSGGDRECRTAAGRRAARRLAVIETVQPEREQALVAPCLVVGAGQVLEVDGQQLCSFQTFDGQAHRWWWGDGARWQSGRDKAWMEQGADAGDEWLGQVVGVCLDRPALDARPQADELLANGDVLRDDQVVVARPVVNGEPIEAVVVGVVGEPGVDALEVGHVLRGCDDLDPRRDGLARCEGGARCGVDLERAAAPRTGLSRHDVDDTPVGPALTEPRWVRPKMCAGRHALYVDDQIGRIRGGGAGRAAVRVAVVTAGRAPIPARTSDVGRPPPTVG